jgi:hypothetical protein
MTNSGEDENNSGNDALVKRMDVLIGLLVEYDSVKKVNRSAEDQHVRLARAGLRPVEIARITGRAPSNIRRDISKARKDGRLPKAVGATSGDADNPVDSTV